MKTINGSYIEGSSALKSDSNLLPSKKVTPIIRFSDYAPCISAERSISHDDSQKNSLGCKIVSQIKKSAFLNDFWCDERPVTRLSSDSKLLTSSCLTFFMIILVGIIMGV